MQYSPYGMPAVASTLIFAVLIYFVIKNDLRRKVNQVAALLFLSFLLWSVAEILQRFTASGDANYDFAVFTERFYGIGVLLSPAAAVHLSLVFPRIRKIPKNFEYLLYLPFFVFMPIVFLTDWFVDGMTYESMGWIAVYGNHIGIYFGYIGVMVLVTISIFTHSWFKSTMKIERNQVAIIIAGVMVMMVLLSFGYMIPALLGKEALDSIPTASFLIIFGIFIFYSIFKYKMFSIEAVIESEVAKDIKPSFEIVKGMSHLIEEKGMEEAYKAFRGMVSETPGLCLSTMFPDKIREERGLGKTPIIWLTEHTSKEMTINPWRLDFEMAYTIKNFMEENPETVIMIDDLEYLAYLNGPDKVMTFLKGITDTASRNNSTVIIPINPNAFDQKIFYTMAGCFDKRYESMATEKKSLDVIKQGYSYLINATQLQNNIPLLKNYIQDNPSLCFTKTYPDKFMKLHGLSGVKTYWLSDSGEGDDKSISPNRLDFELTAVVSEFVEASNKRVFILDGLEHILMENGFNRTLDYIKNVEDMISSTKGVFYATIEWDSLEDNEKATLEKKFDFIVV
jgi:archaellum biogenesis ATPase FlaH